MKSLLQLFISVLILLAPGIQNTAMASNDTIVKPESTDKNKTSPWLATPLISSDPKPGTTLGALLGYMHHFDDKSPVSMFGISSTYSNTDSYIAAVFANMYFDKDRQRLISFVGSGNVNNEFTYERENGQKIGLNTSDNIKLAFLRYSYRV